MIENFVIDTIKNKIVNQITLRTLESSLFKQFIKVDNKFVLQAKGIKPLKHMKHSE